MCVGQKFPPFPPTPKIITRSFVDNVVTRFNHLATCQASCNVPTILHIATASKRAIFDRSSENSEHSVKTGSKSDWTKFRAELCRACNVTTSSKCAIFDKLQEKIRSMASRPAQKVTGKSSEQSIKSVSQATCAYVCRAKVSPHLPPTSPPPPLFPPPHPENNHTVIRRQCCETLQALCNVPSILQPANYLATSQHLLNAPQKVTGKSSERSIKRVSQAACACVGQKFPTPSPPPPHPKNNHTVIRRQCCETFQAS